MLHTERRLDPPGSGLRRSRGSVPGHLGWGGKVPILPKGQSPVLARISVGIAAIMVGLVCLAYAVNRGRHLVARRDGGEGTGRSAALLPAGAHVDRVRTGPLHLGAGPGRLRPAAGRHIRLRVKIRLASKGDTSRALFVNPGGPGGSGVSTWTSSAARLADVGASEDVIGFDPRGVGRSSPLTASRRRPSPRSVPRPDPDDATEQKTYRATTPDRRGVPKGSPALAAHVTTRRPPATSTSCGR